MKEAAAGVRRATPADAAAFAEIYRPYVEETAISFEYAPPDADEMRKRIEKTLEKYPCFAAVKNGEIVGYTYAGPFVNRAAYDCSAELSVYVKRGETRRGIGRLLYRTLERALKAQGVRRVYACIAYPEPEDEYLTLNSVDFHYRMGFSMAGYFGNCAKKFGRDYSMVWMEKTL